MSCTSCGSCNLGSKFCMDCGAPVTSVQKHYDVPKPSRASSEATQLVVQTGGHSMSHHTGPSDPAGKVVDVCDRPLLAIALSPDQSRIVVGSSDHGVYDIDVVTAKKKRTLYNKRFGHAEWVTCVDYAPDGRVLSSGMDSKICVWDARTVQCRDLNDHTGSVGVVKSLGEHDPNRAVSVSYDKTVKVWNITRARCEATLEGHKAAVLGLAIDDRTGAVATSGRDGAVIAWDTNSGDIQSVLWKVHKGPVDSLCWDDTECVVSGGKDGIIAKFDPSLQRNAKPMHVVQGAHASAVNGIDIANNGMIISIGADHTAKAWSPDLELIFTFSGHRDCCYSLSLFEDVAFVGDGAGAILAHSLVTGDCLYGLGASTVGAVRGIVSGPQLLAAVCEDGNVILWDL